MDPSWAQVGVAIAALLLTAFAVISKARAAADDAIQKVETATAVLGERIDGLTRALDRIFSRSDATDARVHDLEVSHADHKARISTLEKTAKEVANGNRGT